MSTTTKETSMTATKTVKYTIQVITADGEIVSSTREAKLVADGCFTYGIDNGAYIEERLVKDALMEQARLFDHQVREERAQAHVNIDQELQREAISAFFVKDGV